MMMLHSPLLVGVTMIDTPPWLACLGALVSRWHACLPSVVALSSAGGGIAAMILLTPTVCILPETVVFLPAFLPAAVVCLTTRGSPVNLPPESLPGGLTMNHPPEERHVCIGDLFPSLHIHIHVLIVLFSPLFLLAFHVGRRERNQHSSGGTDGGRFDGEPTS